MTKQTKQPEAVLPQFYKSVTPLMSKPHANLVFEAPEVPDYGFAADGSAIVLTTDEFITAQMDYPIVFSSGDAPMPVILTGLPGKANQYVQSNGAWRSGRYIPAYVRRYPFVLARLTPESTDLSLCFDSTCTWLRSEKAGNLFAGEAPTEKARNILSFCEQFEAASNRTRAFVADLQELGLLIEAQASVGRPNEDAKVLRGFQMVSEEKLKQLRGDQYGKLMGSGALALIFAHLFSLRRIAQLFDAVEMLEAAE